MEENQLGSQCESFRGPMAMPELRNTKTDEATAKNREAAEFFERGTHARERADDYVRVTAFLATVLLLTAISQRFRSVPARACHGGDRVRDAVYSDLAYSYSAEHMGAW
jgi:hypothetical protein